MPKGVYERKPGKYPRLKRERPLKPCTVEGCDRPANRKALGLCELHFSRHRRRGSFDLPAEHWRVAGRKGRYPTGDGYVRMVAPEGHPLADARGTILEHRFVYHRNHGDGPFACHWCGKEVTWATLHIDHLNDVRNDNSPANLVASCSICNPKRGFHKSLASNRARGLNLTLNGERLPIGVWAERLGIRKESLKWRLRSGWPLERALTERRGHFGPKQQKDSR